MLGKLKTPIRNGLVEIDPEKEIRDRHAGYAEVENIAIFDEAQRSWDQEHLASWLKRKKGMNDFPMSEGEFLIWSLDQREDWAVIVCLVGGGQEINTGEAGIGEWVRAKCRPQLHRVRHRAFSQRFFECLFRRRGQGHDGQLRQPVCVRYCERHDHQQRRQAVRVLRRAGVRHDGV